MNPGIVRICSLIDSTLHPRLLKATIYCQYNWYQKSNLCIVSPEQCNQDNMLVKVASNIYERSLKEIKIAEEKYMKKQYKFKQFMYWQDTVKRKKKHFSKAMNFRFFSKIYKHTKCSIPCFHVSQNALLFCLGSSHAFFSLEMFQQMAPEHQKSVPCHLVSVSPLYSCCESPVELTRYIKHVSTEIREPLIFKALLF